MLPVPPIRLRPSRRALRWVGLFYLAAAMIPLFLPWAVPARLLLTTVVLGDGWLWRRRLRRCFGLSALRVTVDHRLQVEYANEAEWLEVQLAPGCFRWPPFIILHIRRPGARRGERWLLLPDMMTAENWRSLNVWVRWRLPELMPKQTGFLAGLKDRIARLTKKEPLSKS